MDMDAGMGIGAAPECMREALTRSMGVVDGLMGSLPSDAARVSALKHLLMGIIDNELLASGNGLPEPAKECVEGLRSALDGLFDGPLSSQANGTTPGNPTEPVGNTDAVSIDEQLAETMDGLSHVVSAFADSMPRTPSRDEQDAPSANSAEVTEVAEVMGAALEAAPDFLQTVGAWLGHDVPASGNGAVDMASMVSAVTATIDGNASLNLYDLSRLVLG